MSERRFEELDKNYHSREINGEALDFYDGFTAPFLLEGMPFTDREGFFARISSRSAEEAKYGDLIHMCRQGAGELLRFRTDSPLVGVRAGFGEVYECSIRPESCGFDLYCGHGEGRVFLGVRTIPRNQDALEALWETRETAMQEYQLYFPLHSHTSRLEIGITPGSRIEPPCPRSTPGKLVFYGSSITHSGGVTRPGMTYPAIIGRMLDMEVVNMGFGGSCRGDRNIAHDIAVLHPAAAVIEYDHNAADAAELRNTHALFFRTLRELAPELPLLVTSKVDYDFRRPEDRERTQIVMRTCLEMMEAGDRNLEYVPGAILLDGPCRADCTADGCHPNDLGAMRMAMHLGDRLRRMLRDKIQQR